MRKIFIISIILTTFASSALANCANVQILKTLKINKDNVIDLNNGSEDYNDLNPQSEGPNDKMQRYNQLMQIMQDEFASKIPEIADKIGKNSNVKVGFDIPKSTENFVLSFSFYIIMDELPVGTQNENYPGVQGVYTYMFFIDLIDANTNKVLEVYKVKGKYTSSDLLSPEEMAKMSFKLLEEDQMPTVEQLEESIRQKTSYTDAKINYSETDQKADGANNGTITITGIQPELKGEAKNNTVSRFKLEAEKGTFTKTGSKWVEFEGNEYYFGGKKISFDYQTYNCSDFENDKENDTFTLREISQMSEPSNITVKTQKIEFTCDVLYDVKVKYYAKDLAQAEWVWEDVMIAFPNKDGSNIMHINANSYSGDGSEIFPPYIVTIPGYGDEHHYNMCRDEYDTPKILILKSFIGGEAGLYTSEDALNLFLINKTPGNPQTHIELEFDLNIDDIQMTIHVSPESVEEMGSNHFRVKSLDQDVINKLSVGNPATLNYTNKLGATIKIEFEPK